MGGSRPSRRWRAKGHCREVTVSKGAALCSQQGSCVLAFHMGLGKRGSGAQAGIMAHLSGPTQPATKGLAWVSLLPGTAFGRHLFFLFYLLFRRYFYLLCAH